MYWNIWIERFWNTIKREHIYLNPADDGLELYRGIKVYIDYYNNKRAHQGIGRIRPGITGHASLKYRDEEI